MYGRYRSGKHFWEDTNNTARLSSAQGGFNPPDGIPRELYIPNLDQQRAQIGSVLGPNVLSGSSYVIAELDGAFTKYYEGTLETEWKNDKAFVRGSYTWSHYYGNFDQDSSGVTNDANVFIGSSNIGDGAGRQLWNIRYGDLRGDRRHLLKLYGYHALPWNATAGIYGVAQSGQPWEVWSYEPYIALTTNTDRHGPVRRTGRLTAYTAALAGRSELHAERQVQQPIQRPDRRGPFQRREPSAGLQLPAGSPQLRLQHSAELLRSEEIPAGAEIPVLNWRTLARPRPSQEEGRREEHTRGTVSINDLLIWWGLFGLRQLVPDILSAGTTANCGLGRLWVWCFECVFLWLLLV